MKRGLVRIVCLGMVFGVMSTLAIAWGVPAAFGAWRGVPNTPDRFWIDDTRGGHYQVLEERFTAQAMFNHVIFASAASEQRYYKQNTPPAWVYTLMHSMKGDPPADAQAWWSVETCACGWPWRAFRGARYEPWPALTPGPSTFTIVDGKLVQVATQSPRKMVVGLWRFGGAGNDRFTVPLRPMWRGLALNVVVFSGGWIAVLMFEYAGRRWNRVRRGRCRECGYEIGELAVCPECGRPKV